ncbi:MAG: alpha/beta fold hydrolase [Acidimicrobiia bacterium]|nr:alpha/beta fold hydrolase [Acidimicrobiia bacterium]
MALAWTEQGRQDAPPFVLLHSLGTSSEMWRRQYDLAEDFLLVLPDLPGHGKSPPTTSGYDLDTLGADVLAVTEVVGLDRFHLCGVSLGGQVALWAAIHHPHRLLTVTIANSAARIGSAQGWADRISAIREHGMEGMAAQVVGRWFTDGFAQRDPDTWRQALAMFSSTNPDAYVAACRVLAGADLRPEVGRIETPALVIGATDDVSTPRDDAEWLAASIPHARLEIIENAAHLSNMEQPESFTRLLRSHLRHGS